MSSRGRENRDDPGSSSRCLTLLEKQKYIEDYDFPYCDESNKYEKVAKIGQGTFGYVNISFFAVQHVTSMNISSSQGSVQSQRQEIHQKVCGHEESFDG